MNLYMKFFAILLTVIVLAFTIADKNKVPDQDNGGITLPKGFKAVVVADNLGTARHLSVNNNGDVYVKLERLKDGNGIIKLRDKNGDGVAEDISGFGNYIGTGIAIKNGYLYASSNSAVYRYKMENNEVTNTSNPEQIVQGLWDKRQHASKSITLDNAGNIYVNIGAPSNVCQERDRQKGSPGMTPCPILDSAGGIWQFKADKLNQSYGEGERFATGLRNVVGLDWSNEVNDLFVVQHGRDNFVQFFPELYNETEGVELPSEEMFRVKKGDNFGWPYCYYDQIQQKKLLNPEYGGDTKTSRGCESAKLPIVAFPGHWGPNGLLMYTGSQFPARYKSGAFVAFHGSWNRSPRPQEGYFVAFVPMKNGEPTGKYEIFADGFAGENKTPGGARFRPCGLAQGPDGSLYISDDQKGRIWKVMYQ